jgi:hypothetical protein
MAVPACFANPSAMAAMLTLVRLLMIATGLVAVAPRPALAWGRDGHRIVCRIAWQLLDQARRDEVDRLTRSYRNPDGQPVGSFYEACGYADDVRAKSRSEGPWRRFAALEPWHFANVPRTTTRLTAPACRGPCVITAIHDHADSLRRATADPPRAEALFFLGHWVGDLHQPLHVSYADDRGGNSVRPIEGGYYNSANLHALWDFGLLEKTIGPGSWVDFADRLARDATAARRATWEQGTALDWAQESYALITSAAAQYCDWQSSGTDWQCGPRPGGRTLGPS